MGLCIKRLKDESVILMTSDGLIQIKIISNQPTKLNITAPKGVGIWRKELLDENNQLPPRDTRRTDESTIEDERDIWIHWRIASYLLPN